MVHPGVFLFLFSVFLKKYNFFQQINVKNDHPVSSAGIRNPRPLEHESSPITTRQDPHPSDNC